MSKKILSLLLALVLLSLSSTAFAATTTEKESPLKNTTESYFLPNGLLITISDIYTEPQSKSASALTAYASNSYTVDKCRVMTCSDPNTYALYWTYTLKGTFLINPGVSVTCLSTGYSFTPNNSSWFFDSQYTYSNGSGSAATAYGNVTAIRKILFITVNVVNQSTTMTCDSYGNLY